MMDTMKISIAVPSFNYGQYIDACLNSIRQQDYTNFEVLIADGGSADDSLAVIQQLCADDARFKLVSSQDNGQADAIQKAFSHATGDVLCFLNADDCYLTTDTFSKAVASFKRHENVGLVSFGGHYIDEQGNSMKRVNLRYHPLDGLHMMKHRTAVLQPGTFWRREVYESTPWPAEFHYVFDVVFFYRVFQHYSWLELAEPVAGYRLHGANKSLTIRPRRLDELAAFEAIKFSSQSFRVYYLRGIAELMRGCETLGGVGGILKKTLYILVNSLAFLSVYRLPGI